MEEDGCGWTVLHMAAKMGRTSTVNLLLDAGWDLEARSYGGETALSLAVDNGHLETIKSLLVRGAQIDTQNSDKFDKNTPLHKASKYSHNDVLKFLLMCGANQDIRNKSGKTAEDCAENEETKAVFREFNEMGQQSIVDLFNLSINEKNWNIAATLICKGVTMTSMENICLENLVAILEVASKKNSPAKKNIVNFLALTVNEKDTNGNTSLHKAAELNNKEISMILIENGSDIEEKNKDGNTPLHIVSNSNNPELVKFFLNNGASSTQFIKNKDGKIPLNLADDSQNLDVFRIILIDFLNFALKTPYRN